MALAVTHIIGAIIILDLIRHYVIGKQKFPRYLVVVGGIAGIAPDLDIPLGWLVSLITGTHVGLHGVFSHSIIFVGIFVLMGVVRHYQDDEKWAKIFYVIAAGWFIHLLLDCAFNSYETFLWPFKFNLQIFCPARTDILFRSGVDAVLLVAWIIHEELHNKIRDYI